MPTLTIRNLPPRVVHSLKCLALKNRRSMEQEVRELLLDFVADRTSVVAQIESSWTLQKRRPTARQIDKWIAAGRA